MLAAKRLIPSRQQKAPTMQLTLYYAPGTCALVPDVTLTESRATVDVQRVVAYEKQVTAAFAGAA